MSTASKNLSKPEPFKDETETSLQKNNIKKNSKLLHLNLCKIHQDSNKVNDLM